MPPRVDDPVKAGDVLDGKYQVERVLGSGGMGIVVQARHLTLARRVAIKFMRPEALKDGESVARFQREANAAASLLSEHTARVQDTGRLANGAPYMVMEFLVGQDLGELVERSGALPIGTAVALMLQACEALAEAHARGIVHRDIKPRNLFLAQRVDGSPLLKVLDFGLAKHVETGNDHALTRTTAVMGSPQYMSPEQMRASRDVDHRTDIWSLGVCLYELLTGTVPFDAPTVPMLCALVLKESPRPPHELRPDIPLELSAAVMRCLEKEPGARFEDVGALADSLEPFGAAPGSAVRVRGVLTTTQASERQGGAYSHPNPMVSMRSVKTSAGLDATLAHSDTKTAASFDSGPTREKSGRVSLRVAAGVGALSAACLVVVVGLVVVNRSRDRATATPSSSSPSTFDVPVDMAPPPIAEPVSPLATATRDDAGSSASPPAPPPGVGVAVAPVATVPPRPLPGGPRRPPPPPPPPPPTAKPVAVTPTATAAPPPPPPVVVPPKKDNADHM